MLYTYYGDDFTGSTDVLEQLASSGVPAVLFLGVPTAEHLAGFADVQAIGIAGDSRSRPPEWMSANLPEIFEFLKQFDAPICHYKVCSTFDSAPTVGNIGRAIEIGRQVFSPAFVPIVIGAPHLRRYVAFGNLFAAAPDGSIQRIDRHPMSRHPVTPMGEADLRRHLALQSEAPVALVDQPALDSGAGGEVLAAVLAGGAGTVLFDTLDEEDLARIGELIWSSAQRRPLFSASSSGLTAALIQAWRTEGLFRPATSADAVRAAKPLLVVSGSCSAVTERQIRCALAGGYTGVAIDPATLAGSADAVVRAAVEALGAGRDTVLYTSLGTPMAAATGGDLGGALGEILLRILEATSVRRVLLCGGDTSSHAVQRLGLYALTWAGDLQAGAPLCRAHADSALDGLELVLKGGQVGSDDFFDVVRDGYGVA